MRDIGDFDFFIFLFTRSRRRIYIIEFIRIKGKVIVVGVFNVIVKVFSDEG